MMVQNKDMEENIKSMKKIQEIGKEDPLGVKMEEDSDHEVWRRRDRDR